MNECKAPSTCIRKFFEPATEFSFKSGYGFRHTDTVNSAANPDSVFQNPLSRVGRGIRKEKVADSKVSGYVLTGPNIY